MTNATEMIFGTMDSDKSVAVELKHDDKLPVESNTYIQVNGKVLARFFDLVYFSIGSFTLHEHLWSTSSPYSYIGTDSEFILHITLSSM